MKVFIFVLIILGFGVRAQTPCELAKTISIDSVKHIPSSKGVIYFKLKEDSSIHSINFIGEFGLIEINPKECGSGNFMKLDSNGLIIPTQEMIISGVCYCKTCTQRYSRVRIDENTYIKISDLNSVSVTKNIKQVKDTLAWFEKKLETGDKIRLDKILFVGGEARFRNVSYSSLENLYKVLINNPILKIEIQGHVNGPGKRNTKKNQELSEARAKAVMDYLIRKGIDSIRLSSVGFGNTKMIYPKAKSENEMRSNRRVDVLVM